VRFRNAKKQVCYREVTLAAMLTKLCDALLITEGITCQWTVELVVYAIRCLFIIKCVAIVVRPLF